MIFFSRFSSSAAGSLQLQIIELGFWQNKTPKISQPLSFLQQFVCFQMSAAHSAWSISPDQYFNLLVDIYSKLLHKLRGVELQSKSPFVPALRRFGNNSHYPGLLLCWDINEHISPPSVPPSFHSEPTSGAETTSQL